MTMQMNLAFRPGQMVSYISTRSFALGSTGYNIMDGMEVLFDGTNVEVSGNKFTLPTLRGAIKMGWLVPADQYDVNALPQANPSANIQVRPANDLGQNPLQPAKRGVITTVESDERVVMSRGQRAFQAEQRTQEARGHRQAGGGVARAFGGGGGIEVGGAEFGVPVSRGFQTSARSELKVTPDTVGGAIRQAETVKVQPGEGITESEMLARMTAEQQMDYLAAKEARKGDVMSRTVGYVPPAPQTTNLAAYNQNRSAASPQPRPQVVGHAQKVASIPSSNKTVQAEGVFVGLKLGGGTEIADPTGMGGQAHSSAVMEEGMTFRNTNGPKKSYTPVESNPAPEPVEVASTEEGTSRIEKDGTADARKNIAKAICKDFPDEYSFSDHWKRRLAMIRLSYEERFDVIRAIFAAESDDFKKLLLEEFPEAFKG